MSVDKSWKTIGKAVYIFQPDYRISKQHIFYFIALEYNVIYYCIDDDTIPYKGVRGKGTVKISENANYNLPIINKIVTKYLGSTENQMAKGITDSIRDGSAVLLEISPRFYATWDHGK